MNRRILPLVVSSLLLLLSCGGDDEPTGPTFETLAVTTTSLPNAAPTVTYSATLAATGGDESYTWSVTVGSLPTGLSLAASGDITGTPTGSNSTFTVLVTTGDGQTASRELTITFNPTLTVTTTSLVDGVLSIAYAEPVEATGGDGGHTWSLATGVLPTGLSHDTSTGEISGTPTVAETQDFTVEVASADGQTAIQALSITVLATPPVLRPSDFCGDYPGVSIGTFADANLEAAVRSSLGITASDALTCDLLGTVSTVVASNFGSMDITGIHNLTGLDTLNLSGNGLTAADLSAIGGLTGLEWLNLSGNLIVAPNLDALIGLTNLEHLDLGGTADLSDNFNPIGNLLSDISAIGAMTELTVLNLRHTGLVDVSPLSSLTKLTRLTLETNKVVDISPVGGLTDLTFLFLSRNSIRDISALAGLTKLTFFAINQNAIGDISALSGLTELTGTLWLHDNQIASLDGAGGKPNVTQVLAHNNVITDVSGLQGLPSATSYTLRWNGHLQDVQPLLSDPAFIGTSVNLTGTNVSCSDVDQLLALGVNASNSDCPTPSASGSVSVADNFFTPRGVVVAAGGTVTWTWYHQNANAHNVTFASGASSATQTAGTFQRVFNTSGLYDYECTIHGPDMSGTIIVR